MLDRNTEGRVESAGVGVRSTRGLTLFPALMIRGAKHGRQSGRTREVVRPLARVKQRGVVRSCLKGRGARDGGTNVAVSLRDVNEPVNMLTTTSERFEAGSYTRPCIRPDCLSRRSTSLLPRPLPLPLPPPRRPAVPLSGPSDEMIIIVRNRRAAHFRAYGCRHIIFHPLK